LGSAPCPAAGGKGRAATFDNVFEQPRERFEFPRNVSEIDPTNAPRAEAHGAHL
jgi:hypothetical protein